MPWKVSHVMNERMRFVVRLEEGERMTDLCRDFGISRKTGYKFLKRYQAYGAKGLYDEPRRPFRLARAYPESLKQYLYEVKRKHPTWGSKKLRVELGKRWRGTKFPCAGTLHAWLSEAGMVKKRKRRRASSDLNRVAGAESKEPNDIWCADFKGEFRTGDGKYCYPLTITDHFSRYLIGCEGLESVKSIGARQVFEEVFRRYGLPQAILTDNGVPFASPRGLGGFSQLSVWWIRLGINIQRIEPGQPQQNGRHERMHLTLKQETARPAKANILQQQERFNDFLEEYNCCRPHEALEMKYPNDLYRPSIRAYPERLTPLEYPLHDIVRTVSPGGQLSLWKRNRSVYLCKALAGERIGLRELSNSKWLISFANIDLGWVDAKRGSFEPMI